MTGGTVRSGPAVRAAVTAALLVAAGSFVVLGGWGWVRDPGNVERLLTETGVLGPVLFVLAMWATQPLGVPGFVYLVPAAVVWPYPLAIALGWVGNLGASLLAFAYARYLARNWVRSRIPPRLGTYYARLSDGGIPTVVVLRLATGQLPAADWLLGITHVRLRTFLLGTAIGILPGICVAVVGGGSLVEHWRDIPPAVVVVGVVVAVAALVGRSVLRRRARQRAAPPAAVVLVDGGELEVPGA